MKGKLVFLSFLLSAIAGPMLLVAGAGYNSNSAAEPGGWQSPPQEWLDVLHAKQLPMVWTSPTGDYLLLADPVLYPPLSELASVWYELAGVEVNPNTNGVHGQHGGSSPRLVAVADGKTTPLELPAGAEVLDVVWTADGLRLAMTVKLADHIALWVASPQGKLKQVPGLALNPLMESPVCWLPDQQRLLVHRVPERGIMPMAPAIPVGPKIHEGKGASARSTYEARNLLQTAYGDALFEYFMPAELVVIDPTDGTAEVIGPPDFYVQATYSPDGRFILIERLNRPWSHDVAWWRFGRRLEVWDASGKPFACIAKIPVADGVPVHGVRTGPRYMEWRPTAPHSLFWVEAMDGGDPVVEVPYRDRLMRLDAPFMAEPAEVFRAEHRILPWRNAWSSKGGLLLLTQRERLKRRLQTSLVNVDKGTSEPWFERDEDDRYGDPGMPVMRPLRNGFRVMQQMGDFVYFRGPGASPEGDRPFLDLRRLGSGQSKRLFRCAADRLEHFVAFAGDEDHFILRSESPVDVPNYYLATIEQEIIAEEGEAVRLLSRRQITEFVDPTPQLRQIKKEIVQYVREDGVPLSFHLYLPPGYKEGDRLPTVLYAYPLEYSGALTAGQVIGSPNSFLRLSGTSPLFFLLDGYAVMYRTAMPMVGDPETTYDTFVPQLVADAEAAVAKVVEIGVADPERIGVIGHSHGGLMVANLLAHTDLFRAGIARSGSYNKTNQPFGFQSERRSLFEARDVYIQVSPTFFADQVNEPVLIVHGEADSNPGTLTFQSEIFYEAVRGSGGTARLVLLPYEDHGYRARESVEHVLWEQLRWFDQYLK